VARGSFDRPRSSVIAYEASNHYYYTPLDLVEKVLNCRHVIRNLPIAELKVTDTDPAASPDGRK